jgi:hypothetical protein
LITVKQQHSKRGKSKQGSYPRKSGEGGKNAPVLPEFSPLAPISSGCGEEHFKIRQSADQLDVQKNVLRIGFDVSTENQTIFKPFFQKKEVAPFAVKNQTIGSQMQKKPCEHCPQTL